MRTVLNTSFTRVLVRIDIAENRLTTLPDLKHCTALKRLDCSCNRLTTLAGLEQCVALEELNCVRNDLRFGLSGLEHCTALQNLYCSACNLATLDDLKQFTLLQQLRCSRNRLETLSGLERCTNLKSLKCDENRLTTLKALQLCIDLKLISFSSNKLTTLFGLESCKKLIDFHCADNPLREVVPLSFLNWDRFNCQFKWHKARRNHFRSAFVLASHYTSDVYVIMFILEYHWFSKLLALDWQRLAIAKLAARINKVRRARANDGGDPRRFLAFGGYVARCASRLRVCVGSASSTASSSSKK